MRKFKFGNFQIPANAGYKEMIEVILINWIVTCRELQYSNM